MANTQIFLVKAMVMIDSKVLMVRRKKEGHEYNDKWELPGGKIEFGEKPEDAAVRETKEETGFRIKVVSQVPYLYSLSKVLPDRGVQLIIACYLCRLEGGKECLGDHNVCEIGWHNLDDAFKLDCIDGTLDFLRHIHTR